MFLRHSRDIILLKKEQLWQLLLRYLFSLLFTFQHNASGIRYFAYNTDANLETIPYWKLGPYFLPNITVIFSQVQTLIGKSFCASPNNDNFNVEFRSLHLKICTFNYSENVLTIKDSFFLSRRRRIGQILSLPTMYIVNFLYYKYHCQKSFKLKEAK